MGSYHIKNGIMWCRKIYHIQLQFHEREKMKKAFLFLSIWKAKKMGWRQKQSIYGLEKKRIKWENFIWCEILWLRRLIEYLFDDYFGGRSIKFNSFEL